MYVLTDSAGEFAFLHVSCFLFENCHSDMCDVVSHCSFDLYFFFLMISDVEYLFICLMAMLLLLSRVSRV